ncbi:MAG: TfoX/Sxy family protein [Solirubrobacterales bacterium]
MAWTEEFADRIRDVIFERSGVTEKKMFGGIAWMIEGNMAVGIFDEDGLLVRMAREDVDAALTEPGVRPMEMKGRRMNGFVVVDAEITADDEALAEWIDSGATFAESFPPK